MSQLGITTLYQGDTAKLAFAVQAANGSAQSLTGATVRWGYADPDAPATRLLEKTSGDAGISVIDESGGLIQVNIDAGELEDAGSYIQELDVTYASGETYTYAQGPFVIKAAVYPIEA